MSPTVLSVMLRLLLGILWELYPEPPSLKGAFSTFKNYREEISSALEKGGPLAPREGRLLAVEPGPSGAPHRVPRGGAPGFQRRGAGPGPRDLRARGGPSTSPARRRSSSARSRRNTAPSGSRRPRRATRTSR